jgi:hypothetical protein
MHSLAGVHLLNTEVLARLQDTQILGVRLNQALGRLANICNQPIQEIKAHRFPYHHSKNLNILLIRGERIVGNNVLFGSKKVRDGLLFQVWEFFLEFVGESEGHNRETGVVVCGGLVCFSKNGVLYAKELVFAFLAVDIRYAGVPSCGLERLGKEASVAQAVFHDGSVACESEMDQVVVLGDDLGSGTREVEGVGFFCSTQVVQLEDQVLRKHRLVTPNYPAHTSVDEAKLVAGCVDGLDTWEFEVPLWTSGLGVREGCNLGRRLASKIFRARDETYKSSTCCINVNWDVNTGLGLVLVKYLGDLLNGLVMPSVGTSQDDKDPNGIPVNVLLYQFRVKSELALLRNWQDSSLDFEVTGELLQCYLSIGSHDDVGLRRVLALLRTFLLPTSLHRQPAKVDSL